MFVKPPSIIKKILPKLTWEVATSKKEIFLTFDDGSIPEVTPNVLKILNKYGVKATFFCVGENVEKYPQTFNSIIANGHAVGNHSYNHLSGWKTKNDEYFQNIEKANTLIHSKLFRPPYGRIKPSQIKYLSNNYLIIMWSVLTYDFSNKISEQQCLSNSITNVVPGSIIVFHDSIKASRNMYYALPLTIEHFLSEGWNFSLFEDI